MKAKKIEKKVRKALLLFNQLSNYNFKERLEYGFLTETTLKKMLDNMLEAYLLTRNLHSCYLALGFIIIYNNKLLDNLGISLRFYTNLESALSESNFDCIDFVYEQYDINYSNNMLAEYADKDFVGKVNFDHYFWVFFDLIQKHKK